jgi:hypothetical protein
LGQYEMNEKKYNIVMQLVCRMFAEHY